MPKRTKPKPENTKLDPNTPATLISPEDFKLQQQCLDMFRDALKPSTADAAVLQEVKGHLFNRDFATAFGREDYLRVYAGRWSPSRCLGYLQILRDVEQHFIPSASRALNPDRPSFQVKCLGGGAGAEVVALGAWQSLSLHSSAVDQVVSLHASLIDIAAWAPVVDGLYDAMTAAPVLSEYASAAAKEANKPFLSPEDFQAGFVQQDVLSWDPEELRLRLVGTDLVTLMFTLNELYSTSVPKTQALLAQLTSVLAPGAMLLVVDSPGSYSTVSIAGKEKKYPMQWLLDYTLLGSGTSTNQSTNDDENGARQDEGGAAAKWEKLVGEESKWFRLPQGLRYPIELENMRYQIHLYRRMGEGDGG